jgi:hypothetical protein
MINETERRWGERVAEWQASGLTSKAYCEGRPFTAGGLRHWAHRLRKAARVKATSLARRRAVRVVRVERVADTTSLAAPGGAALTVEIGGARLAVTAGFDAGTVRAVMEVLVAALGGRP